MGLEDLSPKRSAKEATANLSWKPDALVASVKALAEDVEHNVVEASEWYMAKRRLPSAGARWTRILAIIFVTLGGIAPVAESTFGPLKGAITVSGTGVGYLFLAAAAACLGLDRYAGFSSTWMRRITTAQELTRLVVDFRVQWPPLLATVEGKATVTEADVKPLFDRIAKLAGDAEDLIKEETQLWKVEFQSSFSQLEKASQARKVEQEVPATTAASATTTTAKALDVGDQAVAGQSVRLDVSAAGGGAGGDGGATVTASTDQPANTTA